MPVNELMEHIYVDYPCIPETVPVEREDGSMGWVAFHHSLEGER